MEYRRILAVGDVHGQYDKLVSLYSQLYFNPEEDLLIFLGDYIQGGDKPCEVLDWLMQHQQQNTVFLRGNTDQVILDAYRRSDAGSVLWISREKRWEMAPVYHDFLATMPFSYEATVGNMRFFFCHAGVNSARSLDDQTPRDLLIYNEEIIKSSYNGEAVLVVGHTQICKLIPGRYTPLIRGKVIMMDTSAKKTEGKLSCMDVLTGNIWQSN
ncbi:metallophosphoesterase [Selenomonas sp. AB3002]|uniref:metallophosphoesterase n=1 Tax=Selenomonas sp. AB3002 TaxID=1392502 RepID=UPI0016398AEE